MLDAAGLEFIDVTGMRVLDEAARAADVPVGVRNADRSFQRY